MKACLRIGLALVALVTVTLALGAWAPPEERGSRFAISIETQSDGSFKAHCESGCHWRDLHYSCNGKVPCCSKVDEHGVHGSDCPTAGN